MSSFNLSTLKSTVDAINSVAPIAYSDAVPVTSNAGFQLFRIDCARTYTLRLALDISSSTTTTYQAYELLVRPASDGDADSALLSVPYVRCVPSISRSGLPATVANSLSIGLKVLRNSQYIRFRITDAASYTISVTAQATLDPQGSTTLTYTKTAVNDTGAESGVYAGSRGLGIRYDATNTAGTITLPTTLDTTSALPDTGVTAGTYGGASAAPVLTINAKGQVTNVKTEAILSSGSSSVLRICQLEYNSSTGPPALGTTGTIPFNNIATNDIGASLASNAFTLPTGSYFMDVDVTLVNASRTRLLLRNVTDNVILKTGTTTFSTDGDVNPTRLAHRFKLTAPKVLRLDFESNSANTSVGFSAAWSSQPESFVQVVIYAIVDSLSAIPTQVCFYAYSSAGPTSTSGPVQWNQTLQNLGNGFDTSTYKFTVPYSGAYYLYFTLFVAQMSQTQDARASMYWQSGSNKTLVAHVHAGNDFTSLSGSATLVLTTGDTVWIENEAASPLTISLKQGHSFFGGYFIGMQNIPTEGFVLSTGGSISGPLGVGTSTVATAQPTSYVLDVSNSTKLATSTTARVSGTAAALTLQNNSNSVNTADSVFVQFNNSNSTARGVIGLDGTQGLLNASPGAMVLGTSTAHNLILTTNSAECVRIVASTGNVGIGLTNPSYRLDVAGGNARVATSVVGDLSGTATFAHSNVFNATSYALGQTSAGQTVLNTANNQLLSFRTNNVTGMALSNGALAINHAAPALALDVLGSIGLRLSTPQNHMFLSHNGSTGFLTVGGAASGFRIQVANGSTGSYTAQTYTDVATFLQSGNVGIGLTNPSYKLDVSGDVNVTGSFRVGGNVLSTGLGWATGGTGNISTLSNVGIGTTSPGYKLHVVGSTTNVVCGVTNSSTGETFGAFQLFNSTGAGAILFQNSSTRSGDGGANTATLRNDLGDLQLQGSAKSGMRITSGGNIGVGTDSPSYKLHVVGTTYTNGLNVQGSSLTTNGNDLFISTGNAQSIWFRPNGQNSANQMQLDSGGSLYVAGNLGVGTSSTSYKLDVRGEAYVSGSFNVNGNIGIGTTSPSFKLHVVGTTYTNGLCVQGSTFTTNGNDLFINTGNAQSIWFRPQGAGNSANQMELRSTGSLYVSGGMQITGSVNVNPGSYFYVRGPSIGAPYTGEYSKSSENYSLYATGLILCREINCTSDERIKENIDVIPGAHCLNVVQAIEPKSYDLKTDGALRFGFIAQEVQNVMPCAVHITGDYTYTDRHGQEHTHDHFRVLDPSQMTAVAWGAIRELTRQHRELSQQHQELSQQHQELRAAFEALLVEIRANKC